MFFSSSFHLAHNAHLLLHAVFLASSTRMPVLFCHPSSLLVAKESVLSLTLLFLCFIAVVCVGIVILPVVACTTPLPTTPPPPSTTTKVQMTRTVGQRAWSKVPKTDNPHFVEGGEEQQPKQIRLHNGFHTERLELLKLELKRC